jgi:acetyltransferase EpsM
MKNKTIVIVGGAAGALIASEIFSSQYKKVMFLETYAENIPSNKIIADKIKNGLDFINKKNVDYFIATGDNDQRKQNYEIIYKHTNKNPVNCIHKTAYVSKSSKMGFGNLICPFSLIHTEAVIGNNTIINSGAIVEHSCLIGDYAQISPNATLCGYVEIGEGAFIGAGSTIIPKIKIGRDSIIAAGSSVIKDVPDKKMFAGVPAVFKKKL